MERIPYEKIHQLQPGKELNLLVAEHATGAEWWHTDTTVYLMPPEMLAGIRDTVREELRPGAGPHARKRAWAPNYSGNLNMAMLLLKVMADRQTVSGSREGYAIREVVGRVNHADGTHDYEDRVEVQVGRNKANAPNNNIALAVARLALVLPSHAWYLDKTLP